ncbi:MAG: tyrosine-type recombinase/integrase, partial [Rhodobacter sp.]|nr:tyrosine-type recombinase/integrase [Rhodobacter sp.]
MTSRRKVSGRSPARTGMTGVMAMKGLSRKTRETCPGSVRRLARHCGRAPHALSAEEVRSWVMGRMERGLSPRTTNAGTSAPRPFFADAMGQPGKVEGPRCRRVPDRLPRSIPEADAGRLIRGIDDPRHRMAALTAYGAGLRIPEVVALQVGDVRGGEGLPRIRAGKGGHERMARPPGPVPGATGRYWSKARPRPSSWLFRRRGPNRPITADSLRAAFNASRNRAGPGRGVTFHCLRHAVATHLHERGAETGVARDPLGHRSPDATRVYARTTGAMFGGPG